jgi:site-specific DNA-cytosine methylase
MPTIVNGDVQNLDLPSLLPTRKFELDILSGGSPCQGFSTANKAAKQEQKAQQNNLAKTFIDKLFEIKPKMFLIENVQGVSWTTPTDSMSLPIQHSLFSDNTTKLNSVQDFLVHAAQQGGYKVWYGVLNAKDYGVPQNRLRFILFGVRRDVVKEGSRVDLSTYLVKYRLPTPTVGDAILDLPEVENGSRWDGENYHPPAQGYAAKMREFMQNGDVFDHFTTKHADYVIERFKKIPQGGNWEDIKSEMQNYKDVENTHRPYIHVKTVDCLCVRLAGSNPFLIGFVSEGRLIISSNNLPMQCLLCWRVL